MNIKHVGENITPSYIFMNIFGLKSSIYHVVGKLVGRMFGKFTLFKCLAEKSLANE